jgi:hypothetical protein
MQCVKCGNHTKDGSNFCALCGGNCTETPAVAAVLEPAFAAAAIPEPPIIESVRAEPSAFPQPCLEPIRPTPPPAAIPTPAPTYQQPPAQSYTPPPYPTAYPPYPGSQPISAVPAPPAPPAASAEPEPQEKVFFGKGAFILCMAAIAVLAGTTAMFAGLYLSQLGS